jgi:DNA-binding Lrp family transcriptional regulator
MKILIVLSQKGTILASDTLNQRILIELVKSEYSVTELAEKLNVSTLKLWRRMQKLTSENMVELARTEKIGNIEKKLYRATAASFTTQQFLEFKPKDPRLLEAFKIYSEIQKSLLSVLSKFNEIPKDAEPVDYGLYVNMRSFAEVCEEPKVQKRISELNNKLSDYGASPSVGKQSRTIKSGTNRD